MPANCLIYIAGIIVSLILTLLLYSYYRNHNDAGETGELMEFAGISLLSWIGVIVLVLEFENQIKEMLLFKRNDNTTI